jgi:hypothetical protein
MYKFYIVDEVSFMSDKILEALDVKLKEIRNRTAGFLLAHADCPLCPGFQRVCDLWIHMYLTI